MLLNIENRRYTGGKRRLLDHIYQAIKPYTTKGDVFADLFAGTGVVSTHMLDRGFDVIVNDLLFSNYVAYQAWLGSGKYNPIKLADIVDELNALNGKKLPGNYFSKIYGGKYYSDSDAKKIGYIRDRISNIRLTERERYILLTSLLYAADRAANTVGHFEHYLSSVPVDKNIVLKLPNIHKYNNSIKIYNQDANMLVKSIRCDIAYIDPPYNSRQYVNFYHVLENLARWNKPTEFEGKSMKFKRDHLKSDYSRSKAPQVLKELIQNLDSKIIVVSYNNTYNAKSSASNNKISEDQLLEILSDRGKVKKIEIKHKSFNAGKTDFVDHKEILYVCK